MDDDARAWNAADPYVKTLGLAYFTAREYQHKVRTCNENKLQETYTNFLSTTEKNLEAMLASDRFNDIKKRLSTMRDYPRRYDEKTYVLIRDMLDYIAEEYSRAGVMEHVPDEYEPEDLVKQQLGEKWKG